MADAPDTDTPTPTVIEAPSPNASAAPKRMTESAILVPAGATPQPLIERSALVSFRLNPTSFVEATQMAKLIAGSNLCPVAYKDKWEDVLIARELGSAVGLGWMQSLQYIAVINGRPAIWGDAALAIAMPALEAFEETEQGTWPADDFTAICRARRKGWPNDTMRRFSIADAKKAGLWTKAGPWQTYPKRMLQMRARGFVLDDCCADRLLGLTLAEVAMDIPAITIETQRQADGVFVAHDPLDVVQGPVRDAIDKALVMLELSPAERRVVVRKYFGDGAATDPLAIEQAAGAMLQGLRDEFKSRANVMRGVDPALVDNGRQTGQQVVDRVTAAAARGAADRSVEPAADASTSKPAPAIDVASPSNRSTFDSSF